MTWMRLDPSEFWGLDEIAPLDVEAVGLFWWLVCRSWNGGGIRDEPEFYKAALRGRCHNFDVLWTQVRSVLVRGTDGKLRSEWLENVRGECVQRLTGDATRKRLERAGRSGARKSGGRKRTPKESTPTDGRTDRQVGGATSAHDWFIPVFEEFPSINSAAARQAFGQILSTRKKRHDSSWDADRLRLKLREFDGMDADGFCRSITATLSNNYKGFFAERGRLNGHAPKPQAAGTTIEAFQ